MNLVVAAVLWTVAGTTAQFMNEASSFMISTTHTIPAAPRQRTRYVETNAERSSSTAPITASNSRRPGDERGKIREPSSTSTSRATVTDERGRRIQTSWGEVSTSYPRESSKKIEVGDSRQRPYPDGQFAGREIRVSSQRVGGQMASSSERVSPGSGSSPDLEVNQPSAQRISGDARASARTRTRPVFEPIPVPLSGSSSSMLGSVQPSSVTSTEVAVDKSSRATVAQPARVASIPKAILVDTESAKESLNWQPVILASSDRSHFVTASHPDRASVFLVDRAADRCDMAAMCTYQYYPYCGTDGQTYPNECELRKEACRNINLEVAYEGECETGSGVPQVSRVLWFG